MRYPVIGKSRFAGAIFPLAITAFAGPGVTYLNIVFTDFTRWLFLAMLLAILTTAGRIFAPLKTKFGLVLLVYGAWCFLTCTWSPVADLSFLKVTALSCTALGFLAAGRYWATGWTYQMPLSYLAPIAFTAAVSIFTGENGDAHLELYQGVTGNPNFLGIIVAASLPFSGILVFRSFRGRPNNLARIAAVALAAVLMILLFRAGSRSALLCAASVILTGIATLRLSKLTMAGIFGIGLIAIGAIAVPEYQDRLYERFVLKHSVDDDAFASRRDNWLQSWEGARQGGWTGLGYGVSYGDTSYSGGFTSVGYGREKGNSQLAIVEEIGWVGLAIYLALIGFIVANFVSNLRKISGFEARMEFALVNGLVFGLLMQSCFEAWWTSPGSVESVLFWSAVGVSFGLGRRRIPVSSAATVRGSQYRSRQAQMQYRF
jgi:O-antigen ligase